MKKGFTLIELLVVIAILAVLATVIVVIINPAELLKQARDTSRVSDVAAINHAIALYLSDVATPKLNNASDCVAGTAFCTLGTAAPFENTAACTLSTSTVVTGSGWVPVNFTNISSGTPLSRLPLDPSNTGSYFYSYACGRGGALNYEIDAKMESTKYSSATTGIARNAEDGGDDTDASIYEVGNSLVQ